MYIPWFKIRVSLLQEKIFGPQSPTAKLQRGDECRYTALHYTKLRAKNTQFWNISRIISLYDSVFVSDSAILFATVSALISATTSASEANRRVSSDSENMEDDWSEIGEEDFKFVQGKVVDSRNMNLV